METPKITISGANEHTDIKDLLALVNRYSRIDGTKIELGIQVSPEKASFGSERYQWLMELHKRAVNYGYVYIALHINPGWVEQVCAGSIPLELIEFMNLFGYHHDGGVILERIQLNFLIGRDKTPDMDRLYRVIEHYNHYNGLRFILPYNEPNQKFIADFFHNHWTHNCDLLFDESHGEGKSPKQWQPAVYDVPQGYSGGLSPDNIVQALDSIFAVNEPDTRIWVDAEAKLKGDDGHLSLDKADAFVANIRQWTKNSDCN